jgi:hypothetical protein
MKLSQSLKIDANNIRIREFTMAGQKLRVRVPLAAEMELMNKRINEVEWQKKYDEFSIPLIERKDSLQGEKIEFAEDDILVDGRSIKETAILAAQTNARIVEMFKLLIPVDGDLENLTYEEIESEFPFSVQLEISKKIAEVISPGYEETRKN